MTIFGLIIRVIITNQGQKVGIVIKPDRHVNKTIISMNLHLRAMVTQMTNRRMTLMTAATTATTCVGEMPELTATATTTKYKQKLEVIQEQAEPPERPMPNSPHIRYNGPLHIYPHSTPKMPLPVKRSAPHVHFVVFLAYRTHHPKWHPDASGRFSTAHRT